LTNQIIAGAIFALTFFFILSEKLDRTIAAMGGAVLMVIFGVKFGFYGQEEALKSIDANTIFLLIGMMILVANLSRTGFLTYVAIKASKISKGDPWRLLVMLGMATTVISMFLDNVTTIVLIAPITILITETLGISAMPFLLTEALLSNIGGVGTLVGDPPNIIIGSAAGFSFNDFLTHLLLPVMVALGVGLVVLRVVFSKELSKKPRNIEQVMAMDEHEAIRNSKGLKRCLLTLAIVIILFFLHTMFHLEPSFIAIIGASLALILVQPDPEEILKDVEWPVLFMFAGLFVLVGGLEHAGILEFFGKKIALVAEKNIVTASLMLLWIAAVICPFIGNIPFTITMVPIIKYIAGMGINANPLWWALALGVGFGCNGTFIGSPAGLITVSISEKTKNPITFRKWLKSGTLVMLSSCLVATLFLLLFPGLFK